MTAITTWATHRASDGYFVVTDERDCLPPDAIGSIVRYEYESFRASVGYDWMIDAIIDRGEILAPERVG